VGGQGVKRVRLQVRWELFVAAKYDIFKRTSENMVIWVEEVEDISHARRRLVSLAASAPAEYRLFSQSLERFVEPDDDSP